MSNELEHHGILGMKWGVRRFQNKDGTLTQAGRKRYDEDFTTREEGNTLDNGSRKTYNKPSSEPKEKREFHLSDNQKTALKVGAAVAVTALAAYGAYKLKDSGLLDRYANLGKEKLGTILGNKSGVINGDMPVDKLAAEMSSISAESTRQISDKIKQTAAETGLKLKDSIGSFEQDCKAANSNWSPSDSKWVNNCSHASMSYIFRRLGLDVEATPMKFDEEGGLSFAEIGRYFRGMKREQVTLPNSGSADEIKSALSQHLLSKYSDDYASGILEIRSNNKGHFLPWEKENGIIRYIEAQAGQDNADYVFKGIASNRISNIMTEARIDDLEIRADRLAEVMKNRG